MKKIKKIVAVVLGSMMSAALFSGCSFDEAKWFNAVSKSKEIKSMESQTDMTLKVSATHMSDKEKQAMDGVLPMLNGAKLSIYAKTVQNEDNTAGKLESKINFKNDSMSLGTGIWVDSDVSGDKPQVKEIFEIPSILSYNLPQELHGKKYLVMDLNNMSGIDGSAQINLTKTMQFGSEFQAKFADFMKKFIEQYNPSIPGVYKVGSQVIHQPNGVQHANIYELDLNDKTFKELMRYTVNNLAGNKDAVEFVKYYIESSMMISQLPEEELNSRKAELDKAFADYESNVQVHLAEINKCFDTIQDLKIVGDNGITIKYAVNDDGYIINETGSAEFLVDLPAIAKLSGQSISANDPAGIYTISLDFSTNIYNINKDLEVTLPEVNSSNSIDYFDWVKSQMAQIEVKDK